MAHELGDRSLWRLDTFRVSADARSSATVAVDGSEGRHAARVLRVRPGGLARVIDGEGWEAVVRVLSVTRSSFSGEVLDARLRDRDEGASLTIAQGLLKGRAFDEVVRRCSELGVAAIVPLVTARVEVRSPPGGDRLDRWRAVALAAVKQSRGVFVPVVREPVTLEALAANPPSDTRTFVAWEEGTVPLRDALSEVGRAERLLAVVGPEGGLEAGEVRRLEGAGARTVSLGPRVLRADWAAAALAAAVSLEMGGLLP